MGELFGTDGIRGVANETPLTVESVVRIGRAVAQVFKRQGAANQIVLAKDTRLSGDMLEKALAAGICSMGVDACLAGTLPTPALAWLVRSMGHAAGVMITASHNPYYDNGIKIFQAEGFKLDDAQEAQIEALATADGRRLRTAAKGRIGRVTVLGDGRARYEEFLRRSVPETFTLNRVKLVVDCANGATYQVAPQILRFFGADVIALFAAPDGRNINAGCGSEHPAVMKETLLESGADLGLALDGDGDRLIAVDEKGRVVSGDRILAVSALLMRQLGRLKNNRVVSTVMSNWGLGEALAKLGIEHFVADVGDRRVVEKMVSVNAALGGEDSGHTVFLDRHTTGDGILTALMILQAMQRQSAPLSQLAGLMTVYPQALRNVEVAGKPPLSRIPAISGVIGEIEKELEGQGRVLVRYSRTQAVCRVMVEGPTIEDTRRHCDRICGVVQQCLGTLKVI